MISPYLMRPLRTLAQAREDLITARDKQPMRMPKPANVGADLMASTAQIAKIRSVKPCITHKGSRPKAA